MNLETNDNLDEGAPVTVHTNIEQKTPIKGEDISNATVKKDAKRILIVDDEEGIVTVVKMFLEHHNYKVITAADDREGLDKARTEKPDLIILDSIPPKKDGYKICGLLKRDTKYAKIPIVLFTAKAQEKDVKLGEEAGADAHITKPFRSEILLSKIEELITE